MQGDISIFLYLLRLSFCPKISVLEKVPQAAEKDMHCSTAGWNSLCQISMKSIWWPFNSEVSLLVFLPG
jgi:hypothetical protein